MNLDPDKLFEGYELSSEEKQLISNSHTAITKDMNYTRVISQLILAKQLKSSTEKFIESGKESAKSRDEHARKMQYLTYALIGVGVLQAIAIILSMCFH